MTTVQPQPQSRPGLPAADAATQPSGADDVSVCIATYRRLPLLDALLQDLAAQTLPPREVVVVDNDPDGSARSVVESHRAALARAGCALVYGVQPEKNISLTRNMTVALAQGTWLAFIDDDERAPPQWLALLIAAAREHRADGVQAPVIPELPPHAPAWIRRGGFYDWSRFRSGDIVPRNSLRFGNIMLAARWLRRQHPHPVFDPVHGLTGGEDGDLLMRLAGQGARLVWCDEAHVMEPVADGRMHVSWILNRALRGGQDFAIHFRAGKLDARPGAARTLVFFGRAIAQMLAAAMFALLLWPLGRHHAVRWLARAYANYGKLSTLWGSRYREYA
ncbi:glycosyltransferase family 2 protein [Bordetella genomosp. 10]|uniref:glycosyltransferase family 2 protein n=1 Tax=Bordetella genomosp. 10 TaxID=1416804 RepID=UPI00211AEA76|nr:glycosyltransferase family 2 protein [Bordetella genomosp. 10]